MAKNNVDVILVRLKALEELVKEIHSNVETHLREGSGVKKDIDWLKSSFVWTWSLVGAAISVAGFFMFKTVGQ